MRRGLAVGCWIAAVVLGVGVGHSLLPDRATIGWMPGPTSRSTPLPDGRTASPGPETFPTDYARTPPTKGDLAAVKTFAKAGLDVSVYYLGDSAEQNIGATFCSDKAGPGGRTWADLTGYLPTLSGNWSDKHSDGNAVQSIAVADSPQAAKVAADQLLASESPCRHRKIGEDVLGPVHQQLIGPGVWAAWMGFYPGDQNTTGEAPTDREPCGGELILRNGQRFGTLDVYLCADTEQLRTLALAAAKRMG